MNRNTLYSEIFVDELARSGLTAVCAAPGSRHTPLMLAFAKHPDIKVYSHLDERSASFFALGLALASDSPVAVICTSGTAGANMYPAIIEAHQSRVPLIVITADRPAELRHSGANQTIDQIKMFGDFVLWFVDTALPEANPPAVAIRNLRTTANRAYATANGLRKGVVHINMPFRKPLEPTPVEGDVVEVEPNPYPKEELPYRNPFPAGRPFTHISFTQEQYPDSSQADNLMRWIGESPKGIIFCGDRAVNHQTQTIDRLSAVTGYPIFADFTSGFRYQSQYGTSEKLLEAFETFLPHLKHESPDIVIQIGGEATSKATLTYFETINPKHYVLLSESGDWISSSHKLTALIQANPLSTCEYIAEGIRQIKEDGEYLPDTNWVNKLISYEATTWQVIDHEMQTGAYFDGGVVYDMVDLIPNESTLFAGNSLPVRLLDQFGKPQNKRIYTYANRGASGIDGNISSALGAGAARPDKPLVAVVGDITFYHDMNGLLAVHRCGVPITLVLLNNNGGGIFHRLPIKDFEPEFTEYFLTPHGLDFSHAAKMYGLEHTLIDVTADNAREHFRQVFSESVNARKSSLIEVRTDALRDLARRDEIVKAVQENLSASQ
ncbi:MAG: 2-succinyl-5-enolpyruvyl-6-hydroxy-3-cyclohexene-1-carboxylic-acid synthase [Aggregatilineales bacterium]